MNKTKYIEGKVYKKKCIFCGKPIRVKASYTEGCGVGVSASCRKCEKKLNEAILGKANKILNRQLAKEGGDEV